jgi:antitoxin Phd
VNSKNGGKPPEGPPKSPPKNPPKNPEVWQLQAAKARFSELFRKALTEGPQIVTRQGKERVVVLPADEFERLTKRSRRPKSLVSFFAESPLAGVQLDLSRPEDPAEVPSRDIEL